MEKQFFLLHLSILSCTRFLYVEFGQHGSESDGGIFGSSEFHKSLGRGDQGLPVDAPLGGIGDTPYFFVGDEAFPLKTYLMRPYSRKSKFSRPNLYILGDK